MHAGLLRYSGNTRTGPKNTVKAPCVGYKVDERTGDPAISINVSLDNVSLVSRTDMTWTSFWTRKNRYVEAGGRATMQ
jgi:hypothetical protein